MSLDAPSDSSDHTVPVFGERQPDQEYVDRPGAYALIEDRDGRLAVVQIHGRRYLPGGGVEDGESLEETLRREVWEECGLQVDQLWQIGAADEYVQSHEEQRSYLKRGAFFAATVRAESVGPVEDGADLLWLTPAEAEQRLVHPSQAWAVRLYAEWAAARRRPQ